MAAYVSVGSEPGTGRLLDALVAAGKRVMLPVLLPDDDLDWAAYAGDRGPGPAPAAGCSSRSGPRLGVEAVATADVVLVPGLAVDRTGDRLGRGGGSYDRALGRVPVGTFTCVLLYDDEVGVAGAGGAARPAGGRRRAPRGNHALLRATFCRVDLAVAPGRVPETRPTRSAVPTYQYACTECGHVFEQVQSFSDDSLTVCPECEGRLRKVFNAVGVVFKGSGFYRTDSRSSSIRQQRAGAPRRPPPSGDPSHSPVGLDASTDRSSRPRPPTADEMLRPPVDRPGGRPAAP